MWSPTTDTLNTENIPNALTRRQTWFPQFLNLFRGHFLCRWVECHSVKGNDREDRCLKTWHSQQNFITKFKSQYEPFIYFLMTNLLFSLISTFLADKQNYSGLAAAGEACQCAASQRPALSVITSPIPHHPRTSQPAAGWISEMKTSRIYCTVKCICCCLWCQNTCVILTATMICESLAAIPDTALKWLLLLWKVKEGIVEICK